MESEKMFIRNKQAAWQQVEENIIVVTSKTRKMHILDGVGYRIWQLMENPVTKAEIVEMIAAEFDAEKTQIEKDIDVFLNNMVDKSAVNILE